MMTKPSMSPCMASPLLPCACISGTSESQTTKIIAPAASDMVYGSIGRLRGAKQTEEWCGGVKRAT